MKHMNLQMQTERWGTLPCMFFGNDSACQKHLLKHFVRGSEMIIPYGLGWGTVFCSFGYSWASFHKGLIICLCCHWYWGHSNKLLPVFLIIFLLYHGQLTSVSFVELPLYHNVTLTHLMSGYTSIGYKLTQLILIFRWKV